MNRQSKRRSIYYWLIFGFAIIVVIILAWITKEQESTNDVGKINGITNDAGMIDVNGRAGPANGPGGSINATPDPKTTADLPADTDKCAAAEGLWQWKAGRCWPNNEATCRKADGLWLADDQGVFECLVTTTDSGKICSDNSECQGLCIVGNAQLKAQTTHDDELTDITGTCAPRIPVQGCVTAVAGGIPGVVCPNGGQ